jgi:6-pyruvoyltetrahydropterin/6-carboxytetrahydropterin synthase
MVVNIKEIDDVVRERVVSLFNQKSINDEVESMRGVAPSVENLLLRFAHDLQGLPGGVSLDSLKLEETPLLYGEWSSNGMVTLTRTYEFAASHRLHVPSMSHDENMGLFGKCNNPRGHGHNYLLEVTVSGTPDPVTGMICDLGALDLVVETEVVGRYDHKNLSEDIPEFQGVNATSEVVVAEIFKRLDGKLPARLERTRLYETARNMFEVVREQV